MNAEVTDGIRAMETSLSMVFQSAYAFNHNTLGLGVIESDKIAHRACQQQLAHFIANIRARAEARGALGQHRKECSLSGCTNLTWGGCHIARELERKPKELCE